MAGFVKVKTQYFLSIFGVFVQGIVWAAQGIQDFGFGGLQPLECIKKGLTEIPSHPWSASQARVWAAVNTIPMFKTVERVNTVLRPIGIKHSLCRVLHKSVASQNRHILQSFLEPQQLCMSPGGGHKLIHMVRMLLELHPDWVCLKTDVVNAHNSISRASIVETTESEPALRHLSQFLASILAMPSVLETGGEPWGESGDGLAQGDGMSSAAFAVGLHQDVKLLDAEMAVAGGCAVFGNDDGYVLGPPAAVYPAVDSFARRILARCGLVLQRGQDRQKCKTEVFAWGELPVGTPADLQRAGAVVGGRFEPGFVCYGAAIGTDSFVRQHLVDKVTELSQVTLRSCEVLGADLQALWTLLSSSVSQKLSYHVSLQYPTDIAAAAAQADTILWQMLESATQLHIPRQEEGGGVECVLGPPVTSMAASSFQELLVRQPVRRGGLGLRSILDTSPAAFVGSVEMSLPHFGGPEGVCRLLEPLLADLRAGQDGNRWAGLLASGARTGRELAAAWQGLQGEAEECCRYLGKTLAAPLAQPVQGLGEGCVTGNTRARVVEQREELRALVLARALKDYPDQAARPVWVYPQFDRLSQAWILATPAPLTYLSGPVFREAMAAHLCLPSPACRGVVGQPVGQEGAVVDAFGDNVLCAKLPFDTWRHKHDDIKVALVERANHAHIECDAEVFGLFRDLVPAVEMEQDGQLEWARARNGKVPDLSYRLPAPPGQPGQLRPAAGARPQGQPARLLAELKCINAGPSRYPPGNGDKAVDRRARALPREYRTTLGKLDERFHGTAEGEAGPLQLRLEQLVGEAGLQCLVVGRWSEGSQHLHNLVQGLAEARALHLARTTGVPATDGALSTITASYRRILSCTMVKANETCLLARLGHMDAGARGAAGRRAATVREEQLTRAETAAHFAAYIRGRGGPRRGRLPR